MSQHANLLIPPWSAADDEVVRARYAADGAAALARELGRSLSSVRHRAIRLGVLKKPRWSEEDRRRLEHWWGEFTVDQIAERLGRTAKAVFWQATIVQGLPASAQPGQEHLSAAAERTGFHIATFKRLVRWAKLKVSRPMSYPGAGQKQLRLCVDSFEVDEAVRAWNDSETVEAAARARGVTHHKIRLALSRMPDVPKKPRGKRHWRIPTKIIDRALAGAGRRAA